MNKDIFLAELEKELAGATPDERVAALQYYKEYFDDAGPEHEKEILAQLGTPKEIADDIKSSSGEVWAPPEKSEVPELLFEETSPFLPDDVPLTPELFEEAPPSAPNPPPIANPASEANQEPVTPPHPYTQQTATGNPPPYTPQAPTGNTPPYTPPPVQPNNNSIAKIILLVLFILFVVPVGGGLLAGLIGTLVGLSITVITMLFIPIILAFAFIAGGVACIVCSIFVLAVSIPNGLFLLGSSIILLSVGLLFGVLGVAIISKLIPAFVRGISGFIRKTWGWIANSFRYFFGTHSN